MVIKPYIDEDKRNIDKLTPHQIVEECQGVVESESACCIACCV